MWFSYKQLFVLGLVFMILQVTFTDAMEKENSTGKQSPRRRPRSPPPGGAKVHERAQYYSGATEDFGVKPGYVPPGGRNTETSMKPEDKEKI